MELAVNPIRMVLNGGYPPGTEGNPDPYGMPPFAGLLSDNEVAAVVSYIRTAWGNRGTAVSAREANELRSAPLELRSANMINSDPPDRTPDAADERVDADRRCRARAARCPCRHRHRLVVGDVVRFLSLRLPAARSAAMTVQDGHDERRGRRTLRAPLGDLSIVIIVLLALLAAFAGIHQATMPQARVETTDPARLHLSGEFVEAISAARSSRTGP